jgi:NAD+ diphosphatase
MAGHIPFTSNPLDRASNLRHDDDWVAAQLQLAESRFLAFSRLNVLCRQAEATELVWLDGSCLDGLTDYCAPVLLGLRDGVAHFAIDVLDIEATQLGFDGAAFGEVRGIAPSLSAADAGIVAQARSILDWHGRNRFCGACGSPTSVKKGGSSRQCSGCEAEVFPRTDPVVIMVVWRDDKCLLGRRSGRPGGAYSCLAGFVDQGETIEEAVRREVMEEAGVVVDEVKYHASQPWPFPSSLMIGCFAHAATDEVHLDDLELADARWFTRDDVRRALESPSEILTVPGPVAIAHHLLSDWSVGAEAQGHTEPA